ncbi:MAG TPA: DUF892 family protein [Puia sp.]|nr:DUF892 family protein [Puia sp.]
MEKLSTQVPRENSPATKESNLEMLLLDELKELYGAEKHQLLVIPVMKKAASSLKLQSVLAGHLDCTREHAERLEQVFEKMGHKTESRKSEALLGIARECEMAIASTGKGTATRDAHLILAAQKIEHYEIGSYGSLAQLARTLDYDEIADLLETSLLEEKEADDLLTSLAENYINLEASKE